MKIPKDIVIVNISELEVVLPKDICNLKTEEE